jgi:putative ABC transport system permease protein
LFTLRLKEIGVRKSLGAARPTILNQFLIESMSNVILALILAIVLVALLLPTLAAKLSVNWTLGQLILIPGVWISIVGLLTAGFVVGLYPSLVMANQNAGEILYGRVKMIMQGTWLKNSLMVLQIFIAVFILMAALVARKQLQFMEEKDLGYNKESMLTIPHGRSIREKTESVKQEMMQTGSIVSATLSSQLPSRGLGFKVPAIVEGGNPNGTAEPWPVSVVSVDFDFFQTFDLRLKEGRTFSTQFPSDSTEGFVINEAMARSLNWSSPIGKEIEMTYNVGNGTVETRKGRVIGVINDFNFESLHKNIEPVVFIFKPFWFYYVTFRLNPGVTAAHLDALAAKWKSIEPDAPFEYTFMTDRLEQLYVREHAWASGVNFFSAIAIAISSLGLLGLISFIVQTKMREIAVRKVLGAGISSIFLKLYGSMFVLILIAIAFALPIGWYACTWWLNGFAYRVSIGIDVYAMAALAVILVSTVAVLNRILRAANVNPVDVLKMQ